MMNSDKFWRVFAWIIIIIDLIIIIPLISFLISKYTDINLVIVSFLVALISVLLGFIALYIAIKSGERMNTIGEAEIQQSIISIEEIRRKFQWEMDDNPNVRTIEWTTWLNFQYLKKALKYKKYLGGDDKGKLLRYHQIIMKFILDMEGTPMKLNFVNNTHVRQLVMGCKLLKRELEDIGLYEEKYRKLLRNYITIEKEDKDFIQYLNIIDQELKKRGIKSVKT